MDEGGLSISLCGHFTSLHPNPQIILSVFSLSWKALCLSIIHLLLFHSIRNLHCPHFVGKGYFTVALVLTSRHPLELSCLVRVHHTLQIRSLFQTGYAHEVALGLQN